MENNEELEGKSGVDNTEENATEEAEPTNQDKPTEDFWNPDTWGKTPDEIGRKAKEVIKRIQTQYNEKATAAKRAKQLEEDYLAAKTELEKLSLEVQQSLADPRKYYEERKKLGYGEAMAEPKTPDFSKMQTVDDVQNAFKSMKDYFERQIADIKQAALHEAESKIKQAVDPISRERWSVALEKMKNKYGDVWPSVESLVAQAITSGKYGYKPGMESDVLERAFRGECPEEYEKYLISKIKEKAERKSKSVTNPPRGRTPNAKPDGKDMDSMIARANARING